MRMRVRMRVLISKGPSPYPTADGGHFDHRGGSRGPDEDMGGQGPENLNLVELDQPIDRKENRGPYHRVRFRPPQGLEGQEPEFFEGPAKNQFRGVGTENQSDTGSPASIMVATWRKRRHPEPEATMPNAVVEHDPNEESRNTETQQQFYDMQMR